MTNFWITCTILRGHWRRNTKLGIVTCLKKKRFIHWFFFWLRWSLVLAVGPPQMRQEAGYSLGEVRRPLTAVVSLLRTAWGCKLQSRTVWAQELRLTGSRALAQLPWHTALAVLRHLGSSQTRNQTSVPSFRKRFLHHWAAREAQQLLIIAYFSSQEQSMTWKLELSS